MLDFLCNYRLSVVRYIPRDRELFGMMKVIEKPIEY